MLKELSEMVKDSDATEELYEALIAIKVVANVLAEQVLEKIRIQSAIEDFMQ